MKKDAYYFSHDSNARHDPKLVTFINEYGLLGYSYFFILIELLREQDQYQLPLHLLGALTKEWQTPNKERKVKESKVKESKVKDNTTSYPAFEKAVFAGWNSFCGSYPVLAKIKE